MSFIEFCGSASPSRRLILILWYSWNTFYFLTEYYDILGALSTFWRNTMIFLEHFLLFDGILWYSWNTFYFLMEYYDILGALSTFWWNTMIFLEHFLLFDRILWYSWNTFYFLIEYYDILLPFSVFYFFSFRSMRIGREIARENANKKWKNPDPPPNAGFWFRFF